MQPQNQQMPYGMFQDDAEKIQRRRALLAGVMAQAQPRQGQMVGGQYIRGNGLGQVAALIAGALMGKDNTPEMEEAARARYQQSLREGLTGYFDQRDGRAGGVMDDQQAQNLMENDIAPQLPEPIKANPREAVIGAMASRHPELQALGQADLGRMGPRSGLADVKELLPYVDPSAIPALIQGGVDAFRPKTGKMDVTDVSIGNGQWQSFETGPDGRVDLTKPIGEPFAKKPTASDTNVTVGGDKGIIEFQKEQGKALARGGASYKEARNAVANLRNMGSAVDALNSGAKLGIAEPALQVLRKVGAQLGIENAATAPTEALLMALQKATMTSLGGSLGAQISDGDRQFVASFSGNLATTPQALKRMMALNIAASLSDVNQHGKAVDAFATDTGYEGIRQSANAGMGNFKINDPEVAKMVENILSGRESTAGLPGYQAGGATTKPTGAPAKVVNITEKWE